MHDQIRSTTETLPLGQRLLRAGFPRITSEDLRQRLGCDEIQKLENDMIRNRILEAEQKAHPNLHVRVVDDPRSGWYSTEKRPSWWPFFVEIGMHETKVMCTIEFVTLDAYVAQEIPSEALTRVAKAKEIGVENFLVAYPVLKRAERADPIIVGTLADKQMVLVASWK